MKAKEKAEQIIIENDLRIKIVYNNYISCVHSNNLRQPSVPFDKYLRQPFPKPKVGTFQL